MKIWENNRNSHNLVLKGDGFYISYLLPYAMTDHYGFGASDNEAVGETAICKEIPWDCKILNGDFRKEYEELIDEGYNACVKFFYSQKSSISSWSDL